MGETGPEAGGDERGATLWMSLGLATLGFAAGFTTGLSVHEGISSSLLSSIFSFVGGTLLSFSGFSYVLRGSGRTVVNTRRLGLGVLGFALGVTLGQPTGITVRVLGNQWAARCATGAGWLASCDARREQDRLRGEAERREEQAALRREERARSLEAVEARATREQLARKLARAIDSGGKVAGRDTVVVLAAADADAGAPPAAEAVSAALANRAPPRGKADEFSAQSETKTLCDELKTYQASASKDPSTVLTIVEGICAR